MLGLFLIFFGGGGASLIFFAKEELNSWRIDHGGYITDFNFIQNAVRCLAEIRRFPLFVNFFLLYNKTHCCNKVSTKFSGNAAPQTHGICLVGVCEALRCSAD